MVDCDVPTLQQANGRFPLRRSRPAKFKGYQPVTTEGPGPGISQADFARDDAQVVWDELK